MKHDILYSFLNYIRRKDPIGGSISIPEYNQVAQVSAYKYFKRIFGLPEQYQKGYRDPVFGYGLNDISEEKIRPLKVLPVSLTLAGGLVNYPADYFRKAVCYCVFTQPNPPGGYRNVNIPFVNDSKFNERRTTVLDPPSVSDPVGNLHATQLRFLPITLPTVFLEYIKFPVIPIMGYVIDYTTKENIYVGNGAYCQVVTAGSAVNSITLSSGGTTFGSYIVLADDSVEDVMVALTANININTLDHGVRAVYDGFRIVLIDLNEAYAGLISVITGGITINKSNFTAWSIQFDWENDIEAMTDISEIMLDMMGISNRDISIVQYAEKEKAS